MISERKQHEDGAMENEAKHPLDQMADLLPSIQDDVDAATAFGKLMAVQADSEARKTGILRQIASCFDPPPGQHVQVLVENDSKALHWDGSSAAVHLADTDGAVMFPREFYHTGKLRLGRKLLRLVPDRPDKVARYLVSEFLQVYVRYEKIWKKMADQATCELDCPTDKRFGYEHLGAAIDRLLSNGYEPSHLLLSGRCLMDAMADDRLRNLIVPNNRGMCRQGRIGSLLGIEMLTDLYRKKKHKVFGTGEFYLVAQPDDHCQMGSRGMGVDAVLAPDADDGGTDPVGWNVVDPSHMCILDAGTVVKGIAK